MKWMNGMDDGMDMKGINKIYQWISMEWEGMEWVEWTWTEWMEEFNGWMKWIELIELNEINDLYK